MTYTDRQHAWQQGSCACNPSLITAIHRMTGPTLDDRATKTRLLRPGLLTLVIATEERKSYEHPKFYQTRT